MGLHADGSPVVVTATFVADELAAAFGYWSARLGVPYDLTVAPYGQVIQHLLDPAGPLPAGGGAGAVLVRAEDWVRDLPHHGDRGQVVARAVDDLVEAVHAAVARNAVPLVVGVCPPSPGREDGHAGVAGRVATALAGLPGVSVLDVDGLLDDYALRDHTDDYADRLAHTPYTRGFWGVLGTGLVRRLQALRTPRPKLVVVDADNTLWDGVVGEDGAGGVAIGPHRQELQRLLLRQRDAGALLAVSSRNERDDVLAVFDGRPEMRLAATHLTAVRADWRPKSAHLRELAGELGLGLDSLVFLDDSPVECAEVRAALPEVLTLRLPERAEEAVRFLRHLWALDRPVVTDEDRERAESYRVEARRTASRAAAGGLAAFVAGLELDVRVEAAEPARFERLAQLTQRTNQFTTTLPRLHVADLAAIAAEPDRRLWTVDVADRFGDYGLTGAVIATVDAGVLRVDALLLSCRVLGRGVEHRVVAALGRLAQRDGLATVDLAVVDGPRNAPARAFLTAVAGPAETVDGRRRHRLAAVVAAAVVYRPDDVAPVTADPGRPAARPDADWTLAESVATGPTTAEALDAAIHPPAAARDGVPADAATDTEVAVARLWTDVLRVAPTSVKDSFFALGGQSLQVVRFMARVREVFGVELPVALLFTPEFTVAGCAADIDALGAAPVPDDEIDLLLAEVEAMTDDEVAALLADESV